MADQEKGQITSLIDHYIDQAIVLGASDLHVEPESESVLIRMRIDGIMKEVEKLPLNMLSNLITRVKVLASLNISESRLPQDGRFEIKKEDRVIDMRVSVMPTVYGECAVIRLLNQDKLRTSFKELGFSEAQESIFTNIISKPYGLILATGPTGSGKTTTLFSVLNRINTPEKCIVTLEDPIEYHLPLVRQTQIDEPSGLTFARGLRALFRQNPDVIMVGEIRDLETAEIAVQAAMTGHMVLSTMHTNDSVGALIRMREMGLEKFLITSATNGIIAQRLVRTLCPNCKVSYKPDVKLLEELHIKTNNNIIFYRAAGCSMCHNTGYIGRTGVFEILTITPKINQLVYSNASWQEMYKEAIAEGMQTLRQSGIEKALEGITTIEEVLRVTK